MRRKYLACAAGAAGIYTALEYRKFPQRVVKSEKPVEPAKPVTQSISDILEKHVPLHLYTNEIDENEKPKTSAELNIPELLHRIAFKCITGTDYNRHIASRFSDPSVPTDDGYGAYKIVELRDGVLKPPYVVDSELTYQINAETVDTNEFDPNGLMGLYFTIRSYTAKKLNKKNGKLLECKVVIPDSALLVCSGIACRTDRMTITDCIDPSSYDD